VDGRGDTLSKLIRSAPVQAYFRSNPEIAGEMVSWSRVQPICRRELAEAHHVRSSEGLVCNCTHRYTAGTNKLPTSSSILCQSAAVALLMWQCLSARPARRDRLGTTGDGVESCETCQTDQERAERKYTSTTHLEGAVGRGLNSVTLENHREHHPYR
jgi:hypothetical protein